MKEKEFKILKVTALAVSLVGAGLSWLYNASVIEESRKKIEKEIDEKISQE